MTSRSGSRPPPPTDSLDGDSLEPKDEHPDERRDSGHAASDHAKSEPDRPAYDKQHDKPHDRPEHDLRSSFERILPELIRRGFEVSRGPLEKVSESLFPKEMGAHIAGQLGDIRSSVVKAVAQEVGRFLRDADIATELRKVLTGLDVDAHVRLRFKAREDGSLEPKVDISLGGSDQEPAARKGRSGRQS